MVVIHRQCIYYIYCINKLFSTNPKLIYTNVGNFTFALDQTCYIESIHVYTYWIMLGNGLLHHKSEGFHGTIAIKSSLYLYTIKHTIKSSSFVIFVSWMA